MKYKAWTTGEIQALRDMVEAGLTNDRIAEVLDRSRGSVASRLYMLRLHLYNTKEMFPGHQTIHWNITVTRDVHDRFREFCQEHGENPGIFVNHILNNFMNLAEGIEDNEEDLEAAE